MKKIILAIIFSTTTSLICNSAAAESFTFDCGNGRTYKEIRLNIDLESKHIKKSWLINGIAKYPEDYIIYNVTDDEIRAYTVSISDVDLHSYYLVLNRYNLELFMASGEDWSHPAKDGNIKGSGAKCKKQEKAI